MGAPLQIDRGIRSPVIAMLNFVGCSSHVSRYATALPQPPLKIS